MQMSLTVDPNKACTEGTNPNNSVGFQNDFKTLFINIELNGNHSNRIKRIPNLLFKAFIIPFHHREKKIK